MKYGKRQLILASLVLALGAAVYLNWQFSDTGVKTEPESTSEPEALGAAQLVNSSYIETVSDTAESAGPDSAESAGAESVETNASAEKLSEARMMRQTARDEAVELLEDVLEDVQADAAAKETAISEAAVIAQNILKETNIESLLQAKGFSECVAYINGDACTIVVNADVQEEQNALIIRDIAVTETGLNADSIRIISAS